MRSIFLATVIFCHSAYADDNTEKYNKIVSIYKKTDKLLKFSIIALLDQESKINNLRQTNFCYYAFLLNSIDFLANNDFDEIDEESMMVLEPWLEKAKVFSLKEKEKYIFLVIYGESLAKKYHIKNK